MHPRRGTGFPGGAAREDLPPVDDLAGWLAGRLPDDWFEAAPEVTVDRDEILVVGRVAAPAVEGDDAAARPAAESGRIRRFREETREQRMGIAREAQHRYGRTVSWGATCGDSQEMFTTLSVPVMTRLRLPERRVLDTLVDAGVARSRSDALAWCVRLVAQHQGDWIQQLRDALVAVEEARRAGPQG
ncbi:MAG: hypothetical protein ACJ74O_16885 [Frankiaceae bacterium]